MISSHLNGNQWYDLDGMIDGETEQKFDISKDGMYYTVVTSDSGCTATSDTFDFMYVSVSSILPSWLSIGPNPSYSGIYQIHSRRLIKNVSVYTSTGAKLPATSYLNGK